MPGMDGVPMSGGWAMSMMWMRMPGQSWPGVAASFLGMWVATMLPMMLPSLVPVLWRYRRSTQLGGAGAARRSWQTALVGAGYFSIWTALGAVVFPLGVALSAIELRQPALARAAPIAVGAVVLFAGALQLTTWKARRLACVGELPCFRTPHSSDARTAWRYGVRLGADCALCCAGLMAIPLAAGIMDLRVMGAITVAVTAERLVPGGVRVARGVGVVAVGAGVLLIARAAGLA